MNCRVLHLIDSGGVYGPETVLKHLMPEQKRNGIMPILGSIGKSDIDEKDIEVVTRRAGIMVRKFRMHSGPNIFGAVRIIRFAREHRVDVIHCHGYKANILMGLLPACIRKIPYVVTLHGWTAIKRSSRLWLYGVVDALLARRADIAVVVADAMRTHPRIRAVGLKPMVVYNGIPAAVHENDRCGAFTIPSNRSDIRGVMVGTIGRLSAEKGFDILLRAVTTLIHSGQEVSLVIIGDGGERRKLEKLVRLKGIEGNVIITGYLPEASKYIVNFDVFVISSLTEGFPVAILEAMRGGIPVIATGVGGIPEALDHGRCGILVNPGSQDELARAISKLCDSPEMKKQFSSAARERVKTQFSVEKMEQGYRKIYEQLLGRRDNSKKDNHGVGTYIQPDCPG